MARGDKWWIWALGVIAIGAAVTVFFIRRQDSGKKDAAGQSDGDDPHRKWRGFSAGQPSLPSATDGAADGTAIGRQGSGDPPIEVRVENIMGAWRHAIINKDADTVISVDRVFATERGVFMSRLITSAETDSEDRVRAFSTRVLGKYRAPECVDVFVRLLADKSEHVRGNAAWGLGELASQPGGREPARKALGALRRIQKQDASAEARDAASIAVKKLM